WARVSSGLVTFGNPLDPAIGCERFIGIALDLQFKALARQFPRGPVNGILALHKGKIAMRALAGRPRRCTVQNVGSMSAIGNGHGLEVSRGAKPSAPSLSSMAILTSADELRPRVAAATRRRRFCSSAS